MVATLITIVGIAVSPVPPVVVRCPPFVISVSILGVARVSASGLKTLPLTIEVTSLLSM